MRYGLLLFSIVLLAATVQAANCGEEGEGESCSLRLGKFDLTIPAQKQYIGDTIQTVIPVTEETGGATFSGKTVINTNTAQAVVGDGRLSFQSIRNDRYETLLIEGTTRIDLVQDIAFLPVGKVDGLRVTNAEIQELTKFSAVSIPDGTLEIGTQTFTVKNLDNMRRSTGVSCLANQPRIAHGSKFVQIESTTALPCELTEDMFIVQLPSSEAITISTALGPMQYEAYSPGTLQYTFSTGTLVLPGGELTIEKPKRVYIAAFQPLTLTEADNGIIASQAKISIEGEQTNIETGTQPATVSVTETSTTVRGVASFRKGADQYMSAQLLQPTSTLTANANTASGSDVVVEICGAQPLGLKQDQEEIYSQPLHGNHCASFASTTADTTDVAGESAHDWRAQAAAAFARTPGLTGSLTQVSDALVVHPLSGCSGTISVLGVTTIPKQFTNGALTVDTCKRQLFTRLDSSSGLAVRPEGSRGKVAYSNGNIEVGVTPRKVEFSFNSNR